MTIGRQFADRGVIFIRVENINDGKLCFERGTLFIDERTHESLARSQILPGDILVSIAGTIGRAAIVPEGAPTLNCNQAVAIVRTNGSVYRPFVRHWLESPEAQAQMRGAIVTGTISNLSLTQLGNLRIPLPPLPEQLRIAEILDSADALRAKRHNSLEYLSTLTQAIFYEMFGDPATNSKEIRKKTLGDLIKLKSGEFLPSTEMATDGKFPVFGGNGINGYHDTYLFDEQKIIIGRVGVYCGCIHVSPPKSWITDNALYVSEKTDDVDFIYLVHALIHANLHHFASQSGQPLVSGTRIYPVEILVPPLTLQVDFAHSIMALEKLKTTYYSSMGSLDELSQSLQSSSFRGEF
jgi:type I restriction enzyme, S subunit